MRRQGPLHRCFWCLCPRCKPTKIPEPSPYKRPGCVTRCWWRCCPSRKPQQVHALEEHRAKQHMWDQKPSPGSSPGSSPRGKKDESGRVSLSRSVSRVTAHDRHVWRCKAIMLVIFESFLTLAVMAANLLAVLFAWPDWPWQGCDPWLAIFIGNIAINAIALVLRFVWLLVGMLMCNIHLVKASQYAKETAEGFDQTTNYHRELKIGHRRADLGERIRNAANNYFYGLVILLILWCGAGWYNFVQLQESCGVQKQWWPAVSGAMAAWAFISLILRCCCSPVIEQVNLGK